MGSVQLVVAPLALAATVVALALVVRAVRRMLKVIRLGNSAPDLVGTMRQMPCKTQPPAVARLFESAIHRLCVSL